MRIKSDQEIAGMRRAGRIAARALAAGVAACQAGVPARRIDREVSESFGADGAEALFLGYRQGSSPPFPASTCISVNHEVVHGVPGDRLLQAGDVVTIDVGVRALDPATDQRWCADTATTVIVVGDNLASASLAPSLAERERLVRATKAALARAIEMIAPGVAWSEVASVMHSVAEAEGLGVVRDYVGHGIGRELHELPRAPAFPSPLPGEPGSWVDFELAAGMTLAVEPIFTLGVHNAPGASVTEVSVRDDGWTVETVDGSVACHVEHTVAVTEKGVEVLTHV